MKYIINIIIFIVLWTIIASILMAAGVATGIWSVDVTRPSSWPGVSGIIAIILAYRLVKAINKSKLKANVSNANSSEKRNVINESSSDDYNTAFVFILSCILFIACVCFVIYGFLEEDYGLSLFFSIPILIFLFWIRQGYVQNDNKIKSSNKRVEVISEVKKDTPADISALTNDLTKLGELKEKGLLTEEEFNEQKKKLLKQ